MQEINRIYELFASNHTHRDQKSEIIAERIITRLKKLDNDTAMKVAKTLVESHSVSIETKHYSLNLITGKTTGTEEYKEAEKYLKDWKSVRDGYREHLTDWIDKNTNLCKQISTAAAPASAPGTVKFEFENNFDKVEAKDVYNHFKTGMVESKMLTEKELQSFLIAAFQNQSPPNKLFNLKNSGKKEVSKVFYQYYTNKAGKPHGRQKEYAGLLGDYFEGYKANTVSSNFSKSVY